MERSVGTENKHNLLERKNGNAHTERRKDYRYIEMYHSMHTTRELEQFTIQDTPPVSTTLK